MAAYTRKQYSGAARNTTTTTLLTNVGTTVDIAATTGWPSIAGIPFYVVINPSSIYEEKCLATISGSTLTLIRAQDDTTASEHQIGSVIYPVFTANDADEANELVSKLTTKGDLLVTDGNGLFRLGVGANGYFLKANSSASVGVEWASIPTINNLNDVGDVTIVDAEEGDFLVYKASSSSWINETLHFLTVSDTAPTDEIRVGDLWYNSSELELYTYFSGSWIQVTLTPEFLTVEELDNVYADNLTVGDVLAYDGSDWYNAPFTQLLGNSFNAATASALLTSRTISLGGDVSGSVSFDGSQNVSINTTIQANSIALGTDTTGNYVQSLTAGTGITLSNNSGESPTPTVAIGQDVGTSASVSFAHVATNSLNVANNVIGGGNITLSPNVSYYEIGDTGPAGGKIFITPSTSGNTTGKYFEAAPVSAQVLRKWATDTDPGIGLGNAATTVVGADGTDIGTGQQNTADIVAQVGNVAATSAAVYCDEYTYGGFSDWFLPSKDELNELYLNQVVIGGFLSSYYSSSSEVSNEAFWFQSFIDGNPNTPYKNNAYYIRPVRSFVAPAPAGIITGNLTGNVTGNVTGNSSTASALQTARTISLTGDVSGSVSFNGSANASIAATIQPNSVALGTDTTGNYMSALTQGTGVTITHTPGEGSNATIAIGQAVGTSASVTFVNVTSNLIGDVTGNADTATALETARTISLGGDLSGSASFNGTSDITISASVVNSGVSLDEISDVVITTPEEFQSLVYDGTNFVNQYASVVTYVRNAEATTLTTGTVVYLFGATGDHASVKRADNDSDVTSSKTVGIVMTSIASGENGPVVTRGYVDGVNLSVGYSAGDVLWLGDDGAFTKTKPTAPEHLVFVGVVVRANSNGIVYVATQNGYELDELHDVKINGVTDGQFLRYNSASTVWVNDTINLGTDTSGDYVQNITAGTGVTISNNSGEGATPTVAIGQDVATSASVTFANVSISGRIDKTTIRESVADTSVSASVVTADYSTGDIFYVGTAPSSNFTVNLTNAPTDNGKAITVVIFVTQGATGYIPNAVQVAGSAQTIKWANGAAPTPTSSAGKIDIFSFTFVRRSAAWTVFGSSNLGY